MKKLLLAIIVIASLLTTNLTASELPMNKQDMVRTTEPDVSNSEQLNLEESTGGGQHLVVVIFTTAIIITIVGLASIFITKFALSLRGKEEDIYIQEKKMPKKDSN